MTTAVVVGSGPNGLAAAIRLAQQGVQVRVLEAKDTVGGGARSVVSESGLVHDECSAIHPTGVASPFFRSLRLEDHGLRWLWPEVDLAHPLDSGSAGVLVRDLDQTAASLGRDGAAWSRLFGPLARSFDDLVEDVFRPVLHWPSHPLRLAGFGLNAAAPASWTARRWKTDEARALFGGVAAHAFSRLNTPLSSSVGLMLTAAGHAHGWPVAEGGSQSISNALVSVLEKLGGTVETGVEVGALDELDRPDVVLLDVSPRAALGICGDRLPARTAHAYRRYSYGPAAYKVDFEVRGDVPWVNEACRKAGTVHVGGTFEQVAAAERDIVRGRMPARPFVLIAQQYLADPSRSVGDLNPVWGYAHVPHGHPGDVTSTIVDQVERFAPGFRERIVSTRVRSVRQMELHNPNYVGGDISVGANTTVQLALRPRLALDPYSTGIPGVYLCSSASPPGPGVHGMCGVNAAQSALRSLDLTDGVVSRS